MQDSYKIKDIYYFEELKELERPYKELWDFEKKLFAPRKKAKQRKKIRKTKS